MRKKKFVKSITGEVYRVVEVTDRNPGHTVVRPAYKEDVLFIPTAALTEIKDPHKPTTRQLIGAWLLLGTALTLGTFGWADLVNTYGVPALSAILMSYSNALVGWVVVMRLCGLTHI
jgi:hypothetical protein